MNTLLINWRNPDGDLVSTVGWLFEQDFESVTLCTDLVDQEDRTLAYRGIVIPRHQIIDTTELAPLIERIKTLN